MHVDILFCSLLASFTSPESVAVAPLSFLWMLPLAAAIAVVYKATKFKSIAPLAFTKACLGPFASIIVFSIVVAAALYIITYFIT